ncbi:hypothetical protein B0F87_102115 [Methylobacter tundripaludum]|uniref:Uncharacterized protein n=1 Tax=Methylobacter tundripaludum TaxID=173365 RepID=A0A2S6HHP9_9GAMM|nr:hypothetical protein [Methylobacter tundripaludum]PPK77009.1 hypothetical protein B0F87_102115 [Methylobacter tundripaludum]
MAKKARFYKVITRNGYGEETHIVSSPKKSVIPNAFETQDVQVTHVEYLGFKEVNAKPNDELDDVEFVVPELNDLSIQRGETGFKNLSLLFAEQVSKVNQEIKKYNSDEWQN